jgi:GNAT superfamily N-acetyltransferase
MLKRSFNTWYWNHGWGQDYFQCAAGDLAIFFDLYDAISPGHSVAAIDPDSGRLMGACFYHPREHHVSLGIMSVDPDYFGRGVGKALVRYKAVRLVGSAINMDSLSLYNRAGFVPRQSYHDMVIAVPSAGPGASPPKAKVRDAVMADIPAIAALEMEISGISREGDYRYCISDASGRLHASVVEDADGGIAGFSVSIQHPALNMIGPAFARGEAQMLALIRHALPRFAGGSVLLVIPMDKRELVLTLYDWGARNVETHLFQVRGHFHGFHGVNLPSFLPETG